MKQQWSFSFWGEAGPPSASAGRSYSFPSWEPHLLQLSLAGTKPKMMETENQTFDCSCGHKNGIQQKKKNWFLTLTMLDENWTEPASEEKTLGRWKNDVLHWNGQEKSFLFAKPGVAVGVFVFYFFKYKCYFLSLVHFLALFWITGCDRITKMIRHIGKGPFW